MSPFTTLPRELHFLEQLIANFGSYEIERVEMVVDTNSSATEEIVARIPDRSGPAGAPHSFAGTRGGHGRAKEGSEP
jgi:hypothetical protein